MITAEHWMEGINKVLDRYGLSREEFWKDPKAYIGVLHADSVIHYIGGTTYGFNGRNVDKQTTKKND